MKQLAVLIITLIIVLLAGMWEVAYLKESSRYILSDLNNVYQIAERKDYELAKQEAEEIKKSWDDVKKTWAIFIDDNQLEEVGDKLVTFVSYIDNENDEEIEHSYNRLSNSIKGVVEFECLKPENIF